MKETTDGAKIKGKDLNDLKVLIGVKDKIEIVKNESNAITLKLDQLDESIKLLEQSNQIKDKDKKATKKLFDEWNGLKKLAKDVNKEITPLVEKESKSVSTAV